MIPRRALVKRIVAQKRRQHPELAADVVTWDGLLAVLERERIALRWFGPGVGPTLLGKAMGFSGELFIFLNPRLNGSPDLVTVAVHELGHCHLRHVFDSWSFADPRARASYNRRCEEEADLYTALILGADRIEAIRQEPPRQLRQGLLTSQVREVLRDRPPARPRGRRRHTRGSRPR